MIASLIEDVLSDRCSPQALEDAIHSVMLGEVGDAALAGLLVALRSRPLQAPQLAAMARALRAHRLALRCRVRPLIDTCGTGGDGSGSFNISTAAAFVIAACGGAVAKHGNRSVSSKTGSADVLEALGVPIALSPDEASLQLDATGFAFLFAPIYHPAVAQAMPARRALGIRSHFNLLGPLSNPALAEQQLLGVATPDLTKPMAEALAELGCRQGLVVHCDGLDEIGLHAETRGHRIRTDGEIVDVCIDPREHGFKAAPIAALRGGEAAENADILRRVLENEPGPQRDVVLLNAAAALDIAGLAPNLDSAIEAARNALSNGAAARVLERVASASPRQEQSA